MDPAEQIVEYARSLFDVAGVSRLPESGNWLLLGLESRPERDLDEFGRSGGRFKMFGFEKHAGPRLESLLAFIRGMGFTAQAAGPYGYPLEGEINLKELAIRAGLGRRGKSTVVLHPRYGPRLRFMAVKTDAPLESLAGAANPDRENPVCSRCSLCIDVCPVNVLAPYRMTDASACLSNITPVTADGHTILCDICLKQCPANR